LRGFSGVNAELEKDFEQIFIDQTTRQLAELSCHVVDGVSEGWKETAHSLKGGAATLGGVRMRDICSAAQTMLSSTAAKRKRMLGLIMGEFEQVKQQLQQQKLLEAI
jgi:HPt (histidine-containing phosphotransfer) domain-containing protein